MGKDESSEIKRTQIHEAVKLRLWGMSAGRCEICNKLLYLDSRYGDDANFAENAHIHAVGKTGPRHVDDMTQDEINNIDNLMLLCAEHHHLIDTKPENYPSDFLIVQKKNHENRIRRLTLVEQGWIVLRFWEHTIRKELEECVNDIQEAVDVRKTLQQ